MTGRSSPVAWRSFLFGVLVGCAAVLLVTWSQDQDERRSVSPDPGVGDADSGLSPAHAAATLDGQPGALPVEEAAGVATPLAMFPAADLPPRSAALPAPTRLRVSLRAPQHWRNGAIVYALPAGVPGTEDDWSFPHAWAEGGNTVDMLLPGPGPWDIVLRSQYGAAVRTDVDASTDGEIEVEAKGPEPVRFEYEGPTATPHQLQNTHVSLHRWQRDAVTYPGRDQVTATQLHVKLDAQGRGQSKAVSARGSFAVRIPPTPSRSGSGTDGLFELVADPQRVTAGETVRLRERPLGFVQVHVRLEGDAPARLQPTKAKNIKETALYGRLEGAPSQQRARYGRIPLDESGVPRDEVLMWPLPPGRYKIEYGIGPLFESRTTTLEVEADEVHPLDIVLHSVAAKPNGGQPARTAGEEQGAIEVPVEFHGIRPRRSLVACYEVWQGEEWSRQHRRLSLTADKRLVFRAEGKVRNLWFLAGPDRASAAFTPVDRQALRVEMRAAGFLVTVPTRIPDERLGGLSLRRTDRTPVPQVDLDDMSGEDWATGDYYIEFSPQALVGPRWTLGPLPVGNHAFDVLLGGVAIARVHGTVREGRISVLQVPVPPAKKETR